MPKTLKTRPWKCGKAAKEGGGSKAEKRCACCGLGHKRVRYLWNVRIQRVRTCSRYAVWPSRLLQARFSRFSAHSPTKVTLKYNVLTPYYAVSSINASMKVSGRRAGAVQDTTSTWAPRVRAVALQVELQASIKNYVYIQDYLQNVWSNYLQ